MIRKISAPIIMGKILTAKSKQNISKPRFDIFFPDFRFVIFGFIDLSGRPKRKQSAN